MAKKNNDSKFARWVRAYGVSKLSRTLGVYDRHTVKKWIRPLPNCRPSLTNAKRIVALSSADPKEIGPLLLEDVL